MRGIYLTLTDANSLNSARTIGVNHIDATYKFIGLDNYADILWGPTAYDRFWSHFIWTIVWTAVCVALHYGIGLGLALLLNQKLRGRTFYRLMLILPWAVPTFVTVFGWRFMLADGGIINSGAGLRCICRTPPWLEDTFWQRFAAIMVNTWCGVPFMMVSLLGGLQSIDARAVRGRRDGRRQRLAALPVRHAARACGRSAPPSYCSASSGPSTSSPSSSCCSATPPPTRRSSSPGPTTWASDSSRATTPSPPPTACCSCPS